MPSSPDLFSIRVTAERTGIGAHTLRMWQRRYGFPEPKRTSGGARRYSDADIATLKLLATALKQGFRPGEVVGKSHADVERLLNKRKGVVDLAGAPLQLEETLQLIKHDEVDRVRERVKRAAAVLGAKRFVTDFAHPLAVALGHAWEQGVLSVQQEHFTSAMLTTQLRVLLNAYDGLGGSPRILLTTLEGETHGLALDMVAVYVALQGAAPRILGPQTPVADIAAAAQKVGFQVVGISLTAANATQDMARQLTALARTLPKDVALWVGGAGADVVRLPQRAKLVGGWQSCDDQLRAWRGGAG